MYTTTSLGDLMERLFPKITIKKKYVKVLLSNTEQQLFIILIFS